MEIPRTSRVAVPVTVRIPARSRAVAPAAAPAEAADAPSRPAIVAVMAALAARRIRGFNCFSYLEGPVRYRITVFDPGPPSSSRPAASTRAILTKRQARAGQLSVRSCTAGSTGCGARSVHRLSVTSGTAANMCCGGAVLTHGADSQNPGGDALGTGPS
jgi:hypothetical protein